MKAHNPTLTSAIAPACRNGRRVLHGRRHCATRQDSGGGGQVRTGASLASCHWLGSTTCCYACTLAIGHQHSTRITRAAGSRGPTCSSTSATPRASSARPVAVPTSTAVCWGASTSSTQPWARPWVARQVRPFACGGVELRRRCMFLQAVRAALLSVAITTAPPRL